MADDLLFRLREAAAEFPVPELGFKLVFVFIGSDLV
jgi:hypothetical protein